MTPAHPQSRGKPHSIEIIRVWSICPPRPHAHPVTIDFSHHLIADREQIQPLMQHIAGFGSAGRWQAGNFAHFTNHRLVITAFDLGLHRLADTQQQQQQTAIAFPIHAQPLSCSSGGGAGSTGRPWPAAAGNRPRTGRRAMPPSAGQSPASAAPAPCHWDQRCPRACRLRR